MSAYATARSGRVIGQVQPVGEQRRRSVDALLEQPAQSVGSSGLAGPHVDLGVLEVLIAEVAERVAAALVSRLGGETSETVPEWLDSRRAAEYLGVHRDTLRKLAAERAIPAEQDGPGCKLFFRRCDLDNWRRAGGRAAHLSSLASAA
jgi:excisionase family DNA binding protein